MKKVLYRLAIIILIASLVTNLIFYRNNKKQELALNKYYKGCLTDIFLNVSDANRILNKNEDDSSEIYEKLYITGEKMSSIANTISLINTTFTLKSRNKGYEGHLDTSQIFFIYENIMHSWADAIVNSKKDKIPSEQQIEGIKEDINKLYKLFEFEEPVGGLKYFGGKDLDELKYEELASVLKDFALNSNINDIKSEGAKIFYWLIHDKTGNQMYITP